MNSALDSQLASGSKNTKLEGNPIALEKSNIPTSTGDEPGTAGGLVSQKFKGKLTWGTCSSDVLVEGQGVIRFMDVTDHNGNSFNTAFMNNGGTGFAYADDFSGKCPICDESPDTHAIREKQEGSLKTALAILDDLKKCEKEWVEANRKLEEALAHLERDQRNSPTMKKETIIKRQAAIAALYSQRDVHEEHRRADSGGYMFGVMVCLTGKKFAAVSGGDMPTKFKSIAESHGCTVIDGAASVSDFAAANVRSAAGDAAAKAELADQWSAVMREHKNAADGYNNEPGTCAGAKLVGKSGHAPDSMTEIYFAFKRGQNTKKTLSFNTFYRGPAAFAPAAGPWEAPAAVDPSEHDSADLLDEKRDMKRKEGKTMPSCQTCQDLLYLVMCDKEKKSCG